MAENVARMIINRDRSGTESLRNGDLLPAETFSRHKLMILRRDSCTDEDLSMYRAARISRDLELTHCAVMHSSGHNDPITWPEKLQVSVMLQPRYPH